MQCGRGKTSLAIEKIVDLLDKVSRQPSYTAEEMHEAAKLFDTDPQLSTSSKYTKQFVSLIIDGTN